MSDEALEPRPATIKEGREQIITATRLIFLPEDFDELFTWSPKLLDRLEMVDGIWQMSVYLF